MVTAEQKIANKFNNIIAQLVQDDPSSPWGRFLSVSPTYRYFYRRGSKDRYFWTTQTVQHNGKPRYVSGIYKYLKTFNALKLTQRHHHAKRADAKARALELYNKSCKP